MRTPDGNAFCQDVERYPDSAGRPLEKICAGDVNSAVIGTISTSWLTTLQTEVRLSAANSNQHSPVMG